MMCALKKSLTYSKLAINSYFKFSFTIN